MRRRRKTAPGSSLDLFLDTICNAFGGIMFLSILIAVLAQLRGNPSSTTSEGPAISHAQADEFNNRIDSLEQERATTLAVIDTLEAQTAGEDQVAILEVQQKVKSSRTRLEQATSEQIETSQKVSNIQSKAQVIRDSIDELDRQLLESKAALADKSKAVDEALDANEQKMELPTVRTTSKRNLIFVMRYGKLYLVSDVLNPGSGGFYSPHVIERNVGQGVRIAPRRDAGWTVTDSEDEAAFKTMVISNPPSNTFLSCAVWPDSFEKFGVFKELLIQLGYDYDLIPVDDVEDLLIGRGGAGTVQ